MLFKSCSNLLNECIHRLRWVHQARRRAYLHRKAIAPPLHGAGRAHAGQCRFQRFKRFSLALWNNRDQPPIAPASNIVMRGQQPGNSLGQRREAPGEASPYRRAAGSRAALTFRSISAPKMMPTGNEAGSATAPCSPPRQAGLWPSRTRDPNVQLHAGLFACSVRGSKISPTPLISPIESRKGNANTWIGVRWPCL